MKTPKEPSKVGVHKDEGITKRTLIMISFVALLVSIFPHAQFVQRKAESLLENLSREKGGLSHEDE